MLLVVDCGNTQTVIGLYEDPGDGDDLVDHWRLSTNAERTSDELALLVQEFLGFHGFSFDAQVTGVAIASGVPRVTAALRLMTRRYFGFEPLVVEPGVRTGMPILYDNPKEVGADRIANAVGAYDVYGGPTIVVDFGTATNFDVLSPEGDYIGGALAPGIEVAAEALFRRGARLVNVALAAPKRAIGRNTVTALQSGIVFGYVGLVEGIIARIQRELGGGAHVIATGGLASLVAHETAVIEHVDPHLTLTGLRLIYELNSAEC